MAPMPQAVREAERPEKAAEKELAPELECFPMQYDGSGHIQGVRDSYPDRISLCSRMPRSFLAIVWNYVTLWSHILVLVVDIAVYDMIP